MVRWSLSRIYENGKTSRCFHKRAGFKIYSPEMAKDLNNAIISIKPFNIEQVLSYYIENVNELKNKAKLCYDYVNKWHNPDYIFSILKRHTFRRL